MYVLFADDFSQRHLIHSQTQHECVPKGKNGCCVFSDLKKSQWFAGRHIRLCRSRRSIFEDVYVNVTGAGTVGNNLNSLFTLLKKTKHSAY